MTYPITGPGEHLIALALMLALCVWVALSLVESLP
jgi:hypothetical protein